MSKSTKVDLKEANFGGIWLRFVALMIDGLILSPIYIPVFFVGARAGFRAARDATPGQEVVVALSANDNRTVITFGLLSLVASAAYQIIMNSSKWQGTVGKKVLSLKIVDLTGGRIDRRTALKRYIGQSWLGILANAFAVGNPVGSMVQTLNNMAGIYIVVNAVIGGTDEKKRTIHDRFAGTYVVSTK